MGVPITACGLRSLVPLTLYIRAISSLWTPFVSKWVAVLRFLFGKTFGSVLRLYVPVSAAHLNELLLEISLLNVRADNDKCVWSIDNDGVFAVGPLCRLIDDRNLPSLDSPTTWDKSLPRKVNIFMWRLKLDKLPHHLNLSLRVESLETTNNNKPHEEEHDDEESPIEQVRLTVPTTDDPTQSVWTFRMWILGLISCVLSSALHDKEDDDEDPNSETKKHMSRSKFFVITPGLNIITEYAMGLIYPGKPIANVCFKTYGYMSMLQAISFLSDFKLGHYMKIPPRSMFLVQFLGTIIAGTVNLCVAWYLLSNIDNICHPGATSDSPWTCPIDHVFFDASVIWGLVGPKRIFGPLGNYGALNWFFLGGIMGPVAVWLCHKAFPNVSWIPLINLPVLLGATASMPPAAAVNYNSWILVGTIFNFFVFRYRKMWWRRYNYILSAALDAGVAFMAVLLYVSTGLEDISVDWWGTDSRQHCDLATCPTAKGVNVTGCPVF
ncbi:oligopeptide transporter 4-like protein [Tanacetum coccineum]